MTAHSRGRDLFIVDNSVSGWTGLRYLKEWAGIAKAFDIATGYFEIGALLALDGKWQGLKRLRILKLPGSPELFRQLVIGGHHLLGLHVMESPDLDDLITDYAGPRNPVVSRVGWSNGTVWLDAAKTNARQRHRATIPGQYGFHGVPEEVWDFQIGGYQVCHKWLKDRKGRVLSEADIAHYQKIVVAVAETISGMAAIDGVIESFGGWPRAFAGKPQSPGKAADLAEVAEKRPRYEAGRETRES